ncbi:glycosyltransferase family 4 protein [Stratiformator vulcanicus]|uniref:GDP-mannose-dependent alpha-(1-6)-phosphatidylinositol monomannoside mannosyltransferase n=1 Tax=Stratiformator vulcanicus TaxID=2527980 RepID=A0A517R4G8_9PLAN|nr:glycosyltransferase family 4 protein [Stratiformator vulcanicus]QDT38784.1 GDP-mannose-dependent alpha-(1-6)-phosphatidylinositol monomannoside mannosyltransferase [Stratiformator vulcanicus]
MRIAIVTAGGAGMFCGSCMHDNTWARALRDAGEDVTLIPLYTPIRVDEENLSTDRVFLGGINLYLDSQYHWWQRVPRWMKGMLDSPRLLNFASRLGVSNDAKQLGELTLVTLAGSEGPLKREIEPFVDFLIRDIQPDVVILSNALLAGVVPALREKYKGRLACVLQGDDIFVDALLPDYRSRVLERLAELGTYFDLFFTHSRYYADYMATYLSLPREKFRTLPLGIDLSPHHGLPREQPGEPFTVGYFARICREKGLQNLIPAFRAFREQHPTARLVAGGYLNPHDKPFFESIRKDAADLGDAFHYAGSPETLAEKIELLRSFDVLSVPTDYHEPKGLYVIEALANGVPVVQPRHGAFPELVEATGGGLLYAPGDLEEHAAHLSRLASEPELRHGHASRGHANVREHYGPDALVRATREALSQ